VSDATDKRDRDDMRFLASRGEFKRFLFRVIQASGLFQRTTNGTDTRNLDYFEGRRSLGLELLDMAEQGQPIADAHPAGPLLTLIQALLAETNQPATEKPNGRRNQRNDRYDDLDPGDGDD
jgi:hypothetical protein